MLPEDTVVNILKYQENLTQQSLRSHEEQNSKKIDFITKKYNDNDSNLFRFLYKPTQSIDIKFFI